MGDQGLGLYLDSLRSCIYGAGHRPAAVHGVDGVQSHTTGYLGRAGSEAVRDLEIAYEQRLSLLVGSSAVPQSLGAFRSTFNADWLERYIMETLAMQAFHLM